MKPLRCKLGFHDPVDRGVLGPCSRGCGHVVYGAHFGGIWMNWLDPDCDLSDVPEPGGLPPAERPVTIHRHIVVRDPEPIPVWVVEWRDEFPAEVDSLYVSEDDARRRADELNSRDGTRSWGAHLWIPRVLFTPQENTKPPSRAHA